MKNYLQKGATLAFVAGADYLAGAPVILGSMIGMVEAAVLTGATGSAAVEGVFSVDKVSAQAWAQGDKIYWDVSLAKFTNVADTDSVFAGVAAKAAANPSAKGELKLVVGGAGTAAEVVFAAGANLVGVDGTGSNAAPLAGTETRLDALDTAVAAIILALKNADLMA